MKKSYQGGTQGTSEVTLSVLNLDKTEAFERAVQTLARKIMSLSPADIAKVKRFAAEAQSFYSSDYVDLVDFLDLTQNLPALKDSQKAIREAVREFVGGNETTPGYAKAHGVSIWMPTYKYSFETYVQRYRGLKFASAITLAYAVSKDSDGGTKPPPTIVFGYSGKMELIDQLPARS